MTPIVSFKVQIAFIEETAVVVKDFFAPEHEQGNRFTAHCRTDCSNESKETTLMSLNKRIYKISSRA